MSPRPALLASTVKDGGALECGIILIILHTCTKMASLLGSFAHQIQ